MKTFNGNGLFQATIIIATTINGNNVALNGNRSENFVSLCTEYERNMFLTKAKEKSSHKNSLSTKGNVP